MARIRFFIVSAVLIAFANLSNFVDCEEETFIKIKGESKSIKLDLQLTSQEADDSSTDSPDEQIECPIDDLQIAELYRSKCPESSSQVAAFEKRDGKNLSDKERVEINFQNRRILTRVLTNGIYQTNVSQHAPTLAFRLLDTATIVYSKVCPMVPVDFISNAFKLFHDLHWKTGQDRTELILGTEYNWILKLIKNCLASVKPLSVHKSHCNEEIYARESCSSFFCTKPEFEFNLTRTDPLVDLMWKVYETVHAVCFPLFGESYRMHHKFAQAIMDLWVTPIRLRWVNQLANDEYWKRVLGPNYELHLLNMERCTEASINSSFLPYRLPRTSIVSRPRLHGDPGVFQKCKPDYKNAVIQFALVQDATSSYEGFVEQLAKVMPEFLNTLTEEFPETQYALTSFVEYEYLMKVNPALSLEDGAYCYKLETNFSKEHQPIIDGIPAIRIQTGGADGPETSLTAVLYTAVEKDIGWSKTPYIKGKKVYKVIALTTDERWKSTDDPGIAGFLPKKSQPPAKGDGTDDCENYPPDPNLVRKTLEKRNIYFLGLIAPERLVTWQGYMTKYQFKPERHKLINLSPDQAKTMVKSLVVQFKAMIKADQCGK